MRTQIFLKKSYKLFFFIVIIFIASCSNADSDNVAASSTTQNDSNQGGVPDSLAATFKEAKTISGDLNILRMEAATFLDLQKRIVFRFYIESADNLTLHGWSSDNNDFDGPPQVRLTRGQISPFKFGPETYLGNIILRNRERIDGQNVNQFKKIKDLIRLQNANSVLFVPQDPSINNGNIYYDIVLSTDEDFKRVSFKEIQEVWKDSLNTSHLRIIPTAVKANPCPPKSHKSEL